MLTILEAQLTINPVSRFVRASDFQVNGVDAKGTSGIFHECHSRTSPAASTICFSKIEFVDEGIAAKSFKAVAQRQHDVAHGGGTILNQPDAAKRIIAQQAH
jgi:hypothetical protein